MSSHIRAYLRVSTAAQSIEGQSHEVIQHCRKHSLRLDEVVEETVSGTKSYRDRKLGELIEKSNRGDTIIVTELSRIGRSMLEILQVLNILTDKGVVLHSVKEGYKLDSSLNSKILSFCLSLCSEVERSLISIRTKEALAARKAAGVKLGRPKGSLSESSLSQHHETIKELLEKGVSQSSISKIIGCASSTLNNYVHTRGLLQNN